jgi:hypothetical protein
MRTKNKAISNTRKLKQTQILIVLLIALALIASFQSRFVATANTTTTESTIVLQTAGAPFLVTTGQVVSNELGNQSDPHVDCNLVSYTFDDFQGSSTIHYKDLETGADNIIPGNQVDLLSDISGSRVAYTEVTFFGDTVRIYDTNSLTTTVVPGLWNSNPSMGADLVAFEDRDSQANWYNSNITTFDVSTGTSTQLTNDSLTNINPEVSPNGNAVIWGKCANDLNHCDVYSAIRTAPGVFTTRALTTGNHEPSYETSTDGELAVYVSDRTGERDIYYQPLTGGNEVHLSIAGYQRNPTISGGLISFEQGPYGSADNFLYDTRTGKLYQVTTGSLDNRLSEISVCGNTGRIVFVNLGFDAFDAHAFTFQVPAVPSATEEQLDDLIALVRSFNLPPGTSNSLIRKLQNAIDAVNASDTATACSSLTAFINECRAQSGKKLTPAQSTQLINSANQIKSALGCP